MTTPRKYPRVLFVTKTPVGRTSGQSASLRQWFQDWPRDHLAELYSGGSDEDVGFSGTRYRLGPADRRCGRLFMALKQSALGGAAHDPGAAAKTDGDSEAPSLRRRLSRLLVGSGLWELIFAVRLSPGLKQWVEDFAPDVCFAQGFDLSFMWLPLLLKRELGVPYYVQISDDWAGTLHTAPPLAPVMRPLTQRVFQRFATQAGLCGSNGPTMSQEYLRRYGVNFRPLMMGDDSARFRAATPRRLTPPGVASIVYSGNLGLNRWEALLDVDAVLERLAAEGLAAHLTAFIPEHDRLPQLATCKHLTVADALGNAEVPAVFTGADVLLLPESFTPGLDRYIALSISTKAHLYMLSERPILLYGPPAAGVVNYGLSEGWAEVVGRRDPEALYQALRGLLTDAARGQELVARAREVAAANHEAAAVRELLRRNLWEAAGYGPAVEEPHA